MSRSIHAPEQEAGVDLWKLPFEDARPERLQYLADNKGKVPVAVNPRCVWDRRGRSSITCARRGRRKWVSSGSDASSVLLPAPRAMKNPEKLAASKKPRVPVYTITGKIAWVR